MSRSKAVAVTVVGLVATMAVTATPAGAAPPRFAPGAPGAGDPYFPDMGNGGYDVGHYDIELAYDPEDKGIEAVTTVEAKALQNLSRFNLDFAGPLEISRLTVNGRTARYRRTGEQELEITPAKGLRKWSRFRVEVEYAGVPEGVDDPGLGRSGWIATADGAVMVNQPIGAATVFPVNDTPRDKATYRFRLTAPKKLGTLANGDLVSRRTSGNRTTTTWAMRSPMASELSMLAIGEYDVLRTSLKTGSRRMANITATARSLKLTPEQGKDFNAQTGQFQNWLAKHFGPYPFTSTGGVVVNGGFGYALETQGRSVYDLGSRPGTIPRKDLLVHELAHQWFGDSSTPSRWKDIWLNEGFATYAEWMYFEEFEGRKVQKSFDTVYATPADDDLWKPKTADPGRNNIFHPTVYDRGAMTVHVLRRAIGEKAFARLLKEWPERNRGGNFSTEEFAAFAEKLSGKQLDTLFNDWVHTSGKPKL